MNVKHCRMRRYLSNLDEKKMMVSILRIVFYLFTYVKWPKYFIVDSLQVLRDDHRKMFDG